MPSLVLLCASTLLLVAVSCAGYDLFPEVQTNTTLRSVPFEESSELSSRVTPGPSIRLPGKGVGTWKEISLSRPRGQNARYTDTPNSAHILKPSFMSILVVILTSKIFFVG